MTEYDHDPRGIIGRHLHAEYRAVWALTTFASLMAERSLPRRKIREAFAKSQADYDRAKGKR